MADITSAKQLREDRAPLAHQIMSLNDKVQAENRDFNAEEREQWDRLNSEYNLFTNRIQIAERTESILTEQNSPIDSQPKNSGAAPAAIPGRGDYDGRKALEGYENHREEPTSADRALAMQAWARVQEGMSIENSHERACRLTGVNPREKWFHAKIDDRPYSQVRRDFRNALSGNSVVGGAGTRPEGFVNSLEMALLAYAQMRQVADVLRTTDGNPITWPTVDNTSNTGRVVGENQTNTAETQPTFGKLVLSAYEYTSDFILIPNSFLTDSAFNLASEIAMMLGERLGRREAIETTTGAGTTRCKGVVTCAGTGVTSGAATVITSDELIDLYHSLDPSNRGGASVGWMFHDTCLKYFRKLKDADGQYLWQPGLMAGEPDTLYGKPVTINQSMEPLVSNLPVTAKKHVLFGDYSKFIIRLVGNDRFFRLDERYRDTDQTAFICFREMDSNTNKVSALKVLLQA